MTTTTTETTILFTICLDISADPHDYPWFVEEDGEQVGHVLDVESADATDEELKDALRAEYPSSYGTISDDRIKIWRSHADD